MNVSTEDVSLPSVEGVCGWKNICQCLQFYVTEPQPSTTCVDCDLLANLVPIIETTFQLSCQNFPEKCSFHIPLPETFDKIIVSSQHCRKCESNGHMVHILFCKWQNFDAYFCLGGYDPTLMSGLTVFNEATTHAPNEGDGNRQTRWMHCKSVIPSDGPSSCESDEDLSAINPAHSVKEILLPKVTCVRHHKCDVCPRTFYSKGSLKRHLLRHGTTTLKCPDCGTSYSRSHDLTLHRKCHRGSVPDLKCHCGIVLPTLYELQSHQVVHRVSSNPSSLT